MSNALLPTLSSPDTTVPVFHIRPTSPWRMLNLRELWTYRELIFFLAWRDVKVRYKQTAIGFAWVVLQPLSMMLVFTLFFGQLAKMPSEGVPYPLFSLVALIPWQLFSRTITESTNCLVVDQRLITRVYFPRIIVPISSTLAGIVDFAVASVLLFGAMFLYGVMPGWRLIWIPAFVLLMIITSLGVGFWLSVLNVGIPRHALCRSLSESVLAVYHTGGLSQQLGSRTMANLAEPGIP
ncbi:MAG: ABC transporter permease [Pirellulaceae bacterium]